VISASPVSKAMGVAIARVGDLCACPLPGHGVCKTAEGDPAVLIDGVPVAFDGHKTECGAQLISSLPGSGRN
jgi:uncharacterized Zn-binding protein involved in type VI secretion